MFSRHLAAAAALALLGATPLVAAAQDVAYNGAPVSVQSCSVAPGAPLLPEITTARWADGLSVGLTNTTTQTVTSVELAAKYDNQTQRVIASRTLAPGADSYRTYAAYATAPFVGTAATCTVEKVSFADGTSWQASAANVSALPAAQAARR